MLPFILYFKRALCYFHHQALTKNTLYIERCQQCGIFGAKGLSSEQYLLIFDQWGSKVIPR